MAAANTDLDGTIKCDERKFRVNCRRLLLTWSQCGDIKPDEIFKFLNDKRPLRYWSIGQEHHQDGGLHVHAYVEYVDKLDIINPRYWDYKGFHPNILRVVKTWQKACNYTRKENGNVVTNIDLELISENQKKNTLKDEILPMVEEGKSLLEIYETDKAFVSRNKRVITEMIELERQFKRKKEITETEQVKELEFWGRKIKIEDTSVKKRHLWIWSTNTDRGKSTFCNMLIDKKLGVRLSNKEIYQKKTLETNLQFYILDPFNGGVYNYADLEAICDGSFDFPVKSQDPICLGLKHIVICANQSIMDRFPNKYDILLARFVEINVD